MMPELIVFLLGTLAMFCLWIIFTVKGKRALELENYVVIRRVIKLREIEVPIWGMVLVGTILCTHDWTFHNRWIFVLLLIALVVNGVRIGQRWRHSYTDAEIRERLLRCFNLSGGSSSQTINHAHQAI